MCSSDLLARGIEQDAQRPSGQGARGVGRRAAVPDQKHRRHVCQRRRRPRHQQNGCVIRGLGMYSAETSTAMPDAHSWDQPGEGDPHARLIELRDACMGHAGSFTWVGLFEPPRDELSMVAEVFDLPRLQVEDAANPEQRPKFEIDDHGHGLALVKVLDYRDSTSDVLTGQLAV